ncbi:MAG: hypothetical protein KGZ68_15130 [Dechloromonas sp.]|nr:hypothetical protein [Dechloromonas sp.]
MTITIVNKLTGAKAHPKVEDMGEGDVFVLLGSPAQGPYMMTTTGDIIDLSTGYSVDFDSEAPVREVNITIEVTA